MFLVDSHCHLDSLDYEKLHKNIDDVVEKAQQRDVQYMLAVATTLPGSKRCVNLLANVTILHSLVVFIP